MEIKNKYSEVNLVMLRRRNSLFPPIVSKKDNATPSDGVVDNFSLVGSILKNIICYGYTLSFEFIERLLDTNRNVLIDWYNDMLMPAIKDITGADHTYRCMYPNFPSQVMNEIDANLFINAIIHYVTNGEVIRAYDEVERKELDCTLQKCKTLTIAKKKDAIDIFHNIVYGKVSASEYDIKDCIRIYNVYFDEITYMINGDEDITNKETLALLEAEFLRNELPIGACLYDKFKTATDVLRLITALSYGDVTLSTNTVFRSIKRKYRKIIMIILDSFNEDSLIEDMWRYKEKWIRVGEIIHPSTYKRYVKANNAFYSIRNTKKPKFFKGLVEYYFETGEYYKLINLLKTRPGEFARILDRVLRDFSNESEYIISEFSKVANKVPVKTLFDVAKHFEVRNDIDDRVFFLKGNTSKSIVIENNLKRIRSGYCDHVSYICYGAIHDILYATKSELGNVYIGNEFKKFIVPFALRAANPASRIVIRGSRMKINDNTNIIRLFTWWTNKTDGTRIDIDLSAGIYDKNWNMCKRIAFTNLRDKDINCCHSGDIVNGGPADGPGVAEFIDIDINSCSKNFKYVAFNLNIYTGDLFANLPNCCFGWMQRENMNDGEIFEPATVDMKIDVKSTSTACIPAILDLETREIIWADMSFGIDKIKPVTIENNSASIGKVMNAIVNMNKPDLHTLIVHNVLARGGTIVNDMEQADIIFTNEDIIDVDGLEDKKVVTAYDVDYFINEMM